MPIAMAEAAVFPIVLDVAPGAEEPESPLAEKSPPKSELPLTKLIHSKSNMVLTLSKSPNFWYFVLLI